VTPGFDGAGVAALIAGLGGEGAKGLLVAPDLGRILDDQGIAHLPPFSILTASSVLFDAVFVAGGAGAAQWLAEADAIDFVRDAYKHCKAVAASGEGVGLLAAAGVPTGGPGDPAPADAATIVAETFGTASVRAFIKAMAGHRLWTREPAVHLPLRRDPPPVAKRPARKASCKKRP
jgi:catalase